MTDSPQTDDQGLPPVAANHLGSQSTSNEDSAQIELPDEAADSDLIEKEWVEKAKEIVEHTRDDPYQQQKALAQMKADYMKKRYAREADSEREAPGSK